MFSQLGVYVWAGEKQRFPSGKALFSLEKDTLWLEKGHFQLPIPSISAFPKNTGVSKKLVLAAQENHFPGFCVRLHSERSVAGRWRKFLA